MRKDLIAGQYENQIEDAKTARRVAAIIERAKALGVYENLQHNATVRDLSGVAFIVNVCEGKSGGHTSGVGFIMDVMDAVGTDKL